MILAENMRNASTHAEKIMTQIKGYVPIPEGYVGWVETSIGKMVPLMEPDDLKNNPLVVFAEPYNTLLADRDAFVGEFPDVEGLETHTGFTAWVDRKLFIHNFGHAAVAYLGNYLYPQLRYTWEVLEKKDFRENIRLTMKESSAVLMHLYPGIFTGKNLDGHILDLLQRFANKALRDTIFREIFFPMTRSFLLKWAMTPKTG